MKLLAILLFCFSINAQASTEMRNKDNVVLTLLECPTMQNAFVAYHKATKSIGCWKGTKEKIIILWGGNTLISYDYSEWRLYETK